MKLFRVSELLQPAQFEGVLGRRRSDTLDPAPDHLLEILFHFEPVRLFQTIE